MGAFLAVAQGSANEPAFITLEMNAGRDDLPTVVLVGKGVTFDSGGLSLKTRDGMIPMKSDMAGAAAVLGAVQAAASSELPLHPVGVCPCVVALGNGVAAGLFSNDDALRDRLERAGAITAERVWPLPLYDDYRRTIDSKVADVQNSGGREGGVGTPAAFLQAFVDYPWAHLDIAGMALSERPDGYRPEGATGFGVRLLVEALRSW